MLNMDTIAIVQNFNVTLPLLYVFVLPEGKTKQYVPKATLEMSADRLIRRHSDAEALVVYYRCGCVRKYTDSTNVELVVDCWLA